MRVFLCSKEKIISNVAKNHNRYQNSGYGFYSENRNTIDLGEDQALIDRLNVLQ